MSGVTKSLIQLETMNLGELREAWAQLYRCTTPPAMSRELLRQAVGYKMQEQTSGGLSRRLTLRIRALEGRSSKTDASRQPSAAPTLKPGAKLLREWQGRVHEVLALDTGQFAYDGRSYRSLSEIAREITGAHWSGPRFFGLSATGGRVGQKANHG